MFASSLFPDETRDHEAFYFRSLSSGSCGNASLLSCGDTMIMIDAGLGIRTLKKSFKELAIDPKQLAAIFVTHDHADHIRGLESFAVDFSLPVYASPLVYKALHHATYLHGGLLNHLGSMAIGETVSSGQMEITSFEVPHDATQNVGYRITGPRGCFTLMTDVGEVTVEVETAIREANYLVIESNYDEEMLRTGPYPMMLKRRILGGNGHLSNREAACTVTRNYHPDLRFLALCHLSGQNNNPSVARESMSNALCSTGVRPGQDLQLEVLQRRVISPLYKLC